MGSSVAGMNGALPMCSPGSPQSRCIMVVLPVRDRKSTSPIPACSSSPASIAKPAWRWPVCGQVRAVAVFFPFRFVADAADDVRAVGRLGVVFAACRDHAPACRVHEQGGDGGGADVHDKGVCLIRGRIADEGFPMHEAEAAHVAVPVAAPAVGAGVAYEGGQGGELAEAEAWPAAPQASMSVAGQRAGRRGRLEAWRRGGAHDGPNRGIRLREPGEHAQGPGLRKGDIEPLSGAGVTGEARPEACVAEQGAFLGAGFGGGEDEALAALADAAGQVSKSPLRGAGERGGVPASARRVVFSQWRTVIETFMMSPARL